MTTDPQNQQKDEFVAHSKIEDQFSILGVTIQIMTIIACIEFITHFILYVTEVNPALTGILDPIFLVLFSGPAIYFFVIKPIYHANSKLITNISDKLQHDPITDLFKQHVFAENLKSFSSECARFQLYGAVLSLNLENLKKINSEYGQENGNFILREIAKQLKNSLRAEDSAYHIDDDNFLILLKLFDSDEVSTKEKALKAATRIIACIRQPILLNKKTLIIDVSAGVSLITPETHHSEKEFIKYVNITSEKAKKLGTHDIVFNTFSTSEQKSI